MFLGFLRFLGIFGNLRILESLKILGILKAWNLFEIFFRNLRIFGNGIGGFDWCKTRAGSRIGVVFRGGFKYA